MKCWILVVRVFRSKRVFYFLTILSFLYLCTLQGKLYGPYKTIISKLPYWNEPELGIQSMFVPGSFLSKFKPSNESYCIFPLGFPDLFDLTDSNIEFSPESGKEGPYRVIYNVLQGSWPKNLTNSITYCSHVTPDFMYFLAEIVIRWEGPVSIAAFVPGYDASTTLCLLHRLCFCIPQMSKLSLHFVFPTEYPPDHVSCHKDLLAPTSCSIPSVILDKRLHTFRNQERLTYPVNVARNVARISAETKFVLVSDVELFPSMNLVSRFQEMIPKFQYKLLYSKMLLKRVVYVLPVFEVEHSILNIPEKKSELLELHAQNKAVYFHRWICLHCQRFPGLQRWIHMDDKILDNIVQVRYVA